jgi:ABC-type polysaccharide transport system permease subunit
LYISFPLKNIKKRVWGQAPVHDADRKKGFRHYLRKDAFLYLLLVLPIAYFLLFRYVPMYGVIIAFKDYNIFDGVFKKQMGRAGRF